MRDSASDSEPTIQLLPRRPRPVDRKALPRPIMQMTNFYEVALQKTSEVHQYVIDVTPNIEDSNIPVWRVLGQQVKDKLVEEVGLLAHKGKMLWGRKKSEQALSYEVTFEGRQLHIIVKQTRSYYLAGLNKLKPEECKLIQHVFNVLLRERMVSLGMEEGTRGRFFRRKAVGKENMLPAIGMQVLRTYNVCLTSLARGICAQVDVGSRILQTNNFLEHLFKVSRDEWHQLTGRVLMATYGNNRTYRIDGIDSKLSPMSTFYNQKREGKISYLEYYQEAHGIKILKKDQPLVRAKVIEKKMINKKLVKEENTIFLVPELMKLTGLPKEVANNNRIMQ